MASVSEVDGQMESCVKLKGLPFKATSEDIAGFFTSFAVPPESILLNRHPDGRPNGEAFVFFESGCEARRATQRDREVFGERFGDRYVRVYPVLESNAADMQAALQQSSSTQQGNGAQYGHSDSVIKIKSLPFDANQLDVIQFFEGFRLKPNGVQLVVRSDNKPTGEAFVDFESVDEAARSVRECDHKVFSDKFGDRYVRLIQVSRKEMQATLALRFGGEGILKMKGIPFKATGSDVRKFFFSGSYRVKADGISFIMHADGRPTGMAFIEFDTPQEAVRAMEKDRAKFGAEYGDRFCMLQLVGRHEMAKVTLLRESDSVGAPGSSNLNKGGGGMYSGMQTAAALRAAALGNSPLLNNPLLSIPWLQQMGLLYPALLNPNSDPRHLGMPGNGLGQLGLEQMSQLQALSAMASKGMPADSHNSMASHNHLGLLQQSMQSHPMLEALMAGQHNGFSGLGSHGSMQNHVMAQAIAHRMSSDMAMSQQRMSGDMMVPQRMGSDLVVATGRDGEGEAEEEHPWMLPQSSDLANAASSWLYYRQQQQQQEWIRPATAEARDFNPLNWAEQLAE